MMLGRFLGVWSKLIRKQDPAYFLVLAHLESTCVALSWTRIVGQNKAGCGCFPPKKVCLDLPSRSRKGNNPTEVSDPNQNESSSVASRPRLATKRPISARRYAPSSCHPRVLLLAEEDNARSRERSRSPEARTRESRALSDPSPSLGRSPRLH